MSISHVPLTEIEAYAKMKGIRSSLRRGDLLYFIGEILDPYAVQIHQREAMGTGKITTDEGKRTKGLIGGGE